MHIDDPPTYEQALFMVHSRPVLDETTVRRDGADLPAVASTRYLIPGTTSGDTGRGSVTSSVSVVSADSMPDDNNVIDCSPPNYFEVLLHCILNYHWSVLVKTDIATLYIANCTFMHFILPTLEECVLH